MSTYSAHKGGSGAYVGLDPAHATRSPGAGGCGGALGVGGGGGHPHLEGVGVEEEVVAGHPEPEGVGEVVGHPELEGVGAIVSRSWRRWGASSPGAGGVGVHLHPEGEVVAGHLLVLGHLFPIYGPKQ